MTSQLYDFNATMSRALAYFPQIKPNEALISIDSMRGICTASAMVRLNKVAQIKKSGTCFKIGASGIRLKLKKIPKQDKFTFEIFGISQYYKLSKEAIRQHKAILTYLTTHKSFEILNIDVAIDLKTKLSPQMPQGTQKKQVWHKGTIYTHTKEARICVYEKSKKHENGETSRHLPKNLIRHEVTLNLTKKDHTQKPQKALLTAKPKPRSPLNINNKRILNKNYKYKNKNNLKNIKSTRDFYYKLLAKKCQNRLYHNNTS